MRLPSDRPAASGAPVGTRPALHDLGVLAAWLREQEAPSPLLRRCPASARSSIPHNPRPSHRAAQAREICITAGHKIAMGAGERIRTTDRPLLGTVIIKGQTGRGYLACSPCAASVLDDDQLGETRGVAMRSETGQRGRDLSVTPERAVASRPPSTRSVEGCGCALQCCTCRWATTGDRAVESASWQMTGG
jgi:hypothetical protein